MVSMPSAPEVASLFGVTPAESVSVNRLQPAVKGENMVECTKSLIELIGNVREIAAENTKGIQEITKYNTNVGNMKYLEKNSPLYICSEGVYLT